MKDNTVIRCSNCNKYIYASDRYCIHCGKNQADSFLQENICFSTNPTDDLAELERKYNNAVTFMGVDNIAGKQKALILLNEISGYKDSNELILKCQNQIEIIKESKRKKKKLFGRAIMAIAGVAFICVLSFFGYKYVFIPIKQHKLAMNLIKEQKYDEAYTILNDLGKQDEILQNKYDRACKNLDDKNYKDAYLLFNSIEYKDSLKMADVSLYEEIKELINKNSYNEALDNYLLINDEKICDLSIEDFVNDYANRLIKESKYSEALGFIRKSKLNDSKTISLLDKCLYSLAETEFNNGNYSKAMVYYEACSDFNANSEAYLDCIYYIALNQFEIGDYERAINNFEKIKSYLDSEEMVYKCKYQYVIGNKNHNDTKAYDYLTELKDINYSNSAQLYNDLYSWNVSMTITEEYEHGERLYEVRIKAKGGKPSERMTVTFNTHYIQYYPYDQMEWDHGEGMTTTIYDGCDYSYVGGLSDLSESTLVGEEYIISCLDPNGNVLAQGSIYNSKD